MVQFPMKSLTFNINGQVVIYDWATPVVGHWLSTGEAFFLQSTSLSARRTDKDNTSQPCHPATIDPDSAVIIDDNKERLSQPPFLIDPE